MKVVIARLYFNKMLMQFEDSFRRNIDMLLASGLVENASVTTTAGLAVDMARKAEIGPVMLVIGGLYGRQIAVRLALAYLRLAIDRIVE